MPRQVIRDFGTCLSFDGSTAYASRATPVSTATVNFSASAWIKITKLPQAGFVFFNSNASNGWGFGIFSGADASGSGLWVLSEATAWGNLSYTFQVGQWYHVVVTHDNTSGGLFRAYVNGVITPNTVNVGIFTPTNGFLLGVRDGGTTQKFTGLIDEFSYYDATLQQADVNSLFYTGTCSVAQKAYYKMDEGSGTSLTDSSGNGNTLTITAATYSPDVFMKPRKVLRDFGTCLSFNGTSSQVAINNSSDFAWTNNLTIMAWIKPSTVTANHWVFGDWAGASSVVIGTIGSALNAQTVGAPGTQSVISASGLIVVGVWQHIAMVLDGANKIIYLNGVNVGSVATTGAPNNLTTTKTIGQLSIGVEWFNGLIDDVITYKNRAFTPADISNYYYSGILPTTPSTRYKLDEGSGTSATDSGASGTNTGTITAATYSSDVFMKPRQVVRDFGTCLRFNGTSDNGKVATPSPVSINFTYACWLNITKIGTFSRALCNGDNTANGVGLYVHTDGHMGAEFLARADIPSTVIAATGVWYFVAVTMTGTTAQMYVNGVASGSPVAAGVNGPAGFLVVGGSLNGSGTGFGSGFPGLVDDTRYYTRTLSATEILNLYYGIEPATTNLILQWKMDEGSGTSLTDSSGNGNTGTITGATYSSNVFMKARTIAT